MALPNYNPYSVLGRVAAGSPASRAIRPVVDMTDGALIIPKTYDGQGAEGDADADDPQVVKEVVTDNPLPAVVKSDRGPSPLPIFTPDQSGTSGSVWRHLSPEDAGRARQLAVDRRLSQSHDGTEFRSRGNSQQSAYDADIAANFVPRTKSAIVEEQIKRYSRPTDPETGANVIAQGQWNPVVQAKLFAGSGSDGRYNNPQGVRSTPPGLHPLDIAAAANRLAGQRSVALVQPTAPPVDPVNTPRLSADLEKIRSARRDINALPRDGEAAVISFGDSGNNRATREGELADRAALMRQSPDYQAAVDAHRKANEAGFWYDAPRGPRDIELRQTTPRVPVAPREWTGDELANQEKLKADRAIQQATIRSAILRNASARAVAAGRAVPSALSLVEENQLGLANAPNRRADAASGNDLKKTQMVIDAQREQRNYERDQAAKERAMIAHREAIALEAEAQANSTDPGLRAKAKAARAYADALRVSAGEAVPPVPAVPVVPGGVGAGLRQSQAMDATKDYKTPDEKAAAYTAHIGVRQMTRAEYEAGAQAFGIGPMEAARDKQSIGSGILNGASWGRWVDRNIMGGHEPIPPSAAQ